jgi:hypothetical protein
MNAVWAVGDVVAIAEGDERTSWIVVLVGHRYFADCQTLFYLSSVGNDRLSE